MQQPVQSLTFEQFQASKKTCTVAEYFEKIGTDFEPEQFQEVEALHFYELDIRIIQVKQGEQWRYESFNTTTLRYAYFSDNDFILENDDLQTLERAVFDHWAANEIIYATLLKKNAPPKPKKTFRITEFVSYVNSQLKRTNEPTNDSYKEGMCDLLEHILHLNNAYNGYNHNYWLEQGFQEWITAGRPDFPEKNKFIYGPSGQEYNRKYYLSSMEPITRSDKEFYMPQP